MKFYLKRAVERIKAGATPFAPTLQIQVEAEEKEISLDLNKNMIDFSKHTDLIVKQIMGIYYERIKNDE